MADPIYVLTDEDGDLIDSSLVQCCSPKVGVTPEGEIKVSATITAASAETPQVTITTSYSSLLAFTRPENATLYSAGDVIGIADSGTPANAGSAIHQFTVVGSSGGAILIDKVELSIGLTSVPTGMANFRLHLYDSAPTAILDNAAFDLTSTDKAKHLGWVDIITPEDVGSILKSVVIPMQSFKLATGQTTLWAELETRGSYTPASATAFDVRVSAKRIA